MIAIALERAAPRDFLELTKPRIVALVMVTMAAGYYLAAPPAGELAVLVHALLGTALVAGGTNALNQVAERDVDALMRRTAGRPIPSGRLSASSAAAFAWSLGALGVVYLAAFVNVTTAVLAATTLLSYVYLYTPLKRRTSLSTLVGAVPGALPIVGGWTAAGGALDARVWVLFWILFLWQLPHFLALSWIYRDDYARAGLKMLSVSDADGRATFRQATFYAAALLPISLAPTVLGIAGAVYFFGALILSGWFIAASAAAVRGRTIAHARRLFVVSLVYLPGILALMAADRLA